MFVFNTCDHIKQISPWYFWKILIQSIRCHELYILMIILCVISLVLSLNFQSTQLTDLLKMNLIISLGQHSTCLSTCLPPFLLLPFIILLTTPAVHCVYSCWSVLRDPPLLVMWGLCSEGNQTRVCHIQYKHFLFCPLSGQLFAIHFLFAYFEKQSALMLSSEQVQMGLNGSPQVI